MFTFATMYKEYLTFFLIIGVFVVVVCLSVMIPSRPLKYRTEKVAIDSISVENDYSFLPDKTWTYYTKYGPTITTNNCQIFKVGDSIEVKLVKINQ